MYVERYDIHVWIDVANALRHDVRLQPADRAVQGVDLAVDVGKLHGVAIDERNMSNRRSCKRFRNP